MRKRKIQGKKLTLYIEDSSKKKWCREKKLVHLFEAAVKSCEFYLFRSAGRLEVFAKGVKTIEIDVFICGAQKIKNLNRDFRNIDKSTDVLSFGLFDNLREDLCAFSELSLGDVFICKDVVIEQAKRFNVSVEEEVIHLFVHGFLHLIGFDHDISEDERKIMEKWESKLIGKISQEIKKRK